MADVTKITLPDGTTKDIKDATARSNVVLLETMNGAKNIAPYNSGEHTGNASYWFLHPNCIDIAAGTSIYLVYDYTQTAGQISIQLTDSNGNIIPGTSSYSTQDTTSGHKATKVTVPSGKTAKGYNAYHSANATVTVSNFMIIPADIYEAGFTDYQPYALPNTALTMFTPTVKDSGNAFTVGTDYTLCDACTLTVPTPSSGVKAAHILAGLTFNSSAPRGIIISLSNNSADFNTSSKMLAKVESSDYIRLTAECFYYNYGGSNVNIYVWAKSSSNGNNRVVSTMQLLN